MKKEPYYRRVQRWKTMWYGQKTKWWYSRFLKGCGNNNVIMPPFFISPEHVILGNQVLIFDYARIEGVTQYEGAIYDPLIVFHDRVQVQQGLYLTCATRIEIGEDTAIAANVTITDIHHPYETIDLPIERQPIVTEAVSIGDGCKIYNNAVILPGTHIGKHCTVGANSVVKGIFPDFSVIVGAPARIVKRYSFEKEAWLRTDNKGNFID
ncbi:MAG: acyltransferase [Bacteroidota bacterium]|nr:acyltransferase [Bacteroidota bacterium]